MLSEDDARHTLEFDDHYAVLPSPEAAQFHREPPPAGGRPCPEGFCYNSNTNTHWLSVEELRQMVAPLEMRKAA
jgi:UDP-N-acetylglucosamine 4,6-dehydratase